MSAALLGRGKALRARLLDRSADLSHAEGRARERHRRMALSTIAAFAARGTSVVTMLVTVPLTINYLGPERFGMWATLSALTALLSFADFGLGNSLLGMVSDGAANPRGGRLRRAIATAHLALIGVAAALAALVVGFGGAIAWADAFNVKGSLASAEAGPAATVFLLLLALGNPIGLIYRVQQGLQEGYRASAWQAAGSIAGLGGVVAAISLGAGLPGVVAAFAGAPLVVALINAVHFFTRVRPDLRPQRRDWDPSLLGELSSSGALFLVLQICAAVLFQSNNLVIAQVLGATAVAGYSVVDRMFSLVTIAMSMLLAPLWPAYRDAAARGDGAWIRRTFTRSIVAAVSASTFMSAALWLLGPTLVGWWVDGAVQVPASLFLGFALWKVMETAGVAVSMLLNGVHRITVQAMSAMLTAATAVGLSIVLTSRHGVSGAIFGTVAAYALFTLPVLGFAVRRALAAFAKE